MATRLVSLTLLLTTLQMVQLLDAFKPLPPPPPRKCNSMTAAYNRGDKIFLFFGTRYLLFSRTHKQIIRGGRVTHLFPGFPGDKPVDAAYVPNSQPYLTVLISGRAFYTYHKSGIMVRGRTSLKRIFPAGRFSKGLDASVHHGRFGYFFRGCRLNRKANKGKSNVMTLKRFGLPCNLDAAFNLDDMIIAVKGPYTYQVDVKRRRSKLFCFYC